MTKTFTTPIVLMILALFALALHAEDKPKPISKDHREAISKAFLKAQAAQLNFFRTREQASAAIEQAQKESQLAQSAVDKALAEARKADKVAEDCSPTIELEWACPAKDGAKGK